MLKYTFVCVLLTESASQKQKQLLRRRRLVKN